MSTAGAGPASCPFCAIIEGAAPAARVLSEPQVIAFLDVRPLFKGHVLVIPRTHARDLVALAPEGIAPLFSAVQRVARAVELGLGAEGSFVALNNTVSQSVPHLHVHVVPRRRKDGLKGFFWPRLRYASETERDDYAARIAAAL